MTRREFIAETAAKFATSIWGTDCVRDAIAVADKLEEQNVAPWQVPEGGK